MVFSVQLQRDTKETKRSVLMSRKELKQLRRSASSVLGKENGDQCFGEEKESDDGGGTLGNQWSYHRRRGEINNQKSRITAFGIEGYDRV